MPISIQTEPAVAPPHRAPPREPAALAALSEATNRCRECPLGAGATQSVIGEGRLGARLMLVGEQPGDQEDLQGRPFVGPAGQLLDRALGALGWPREAVFVTNAVKHFKYELRGKRRIHKTPAQREIAACLHWLEDEIALVRPEAIVAMGATAARALLGRPIGVTSERGHWLEREIDARKVLITLHPSALLRVLPPQRDEAYALWLRDLALASELALGDGAPARAVVLRNGPAAASRRARPAPTPVRGSRRGDR
jgi:uracil-DNA glycosylase family protein